MSSDNDILRTLEKEQIARKESERILEAKNLELHDQKLEIEALRAKLNEKVNRKDSQINTIQKNQQKIFEEHPFSMMIYSLDSLKILNVNNTAVETYGYSKSEFYNLTVKDFHDSEDKKMLVNHITDIKSGKSITKDWRHLKKNKEIIFVKITGIPIEFDGEAARVVVIEDVTERKLLMEKNELHQKKYTDLIEKSSDLIYGITPEGKFQFVNLITCELTGYSEKRLLSMKFDELIRDDYQKRVLSFYQFQLESNTEQTYTEFPIMSFDKEEIWLGQNVNISKNKSGEIEISVIARVITEKRAFEKALLRSEEKFRSIIENMEFGLLETDPSGKIVKAHKSFCDLVGYSQKELEGTNGDFMLEKNTIKVMKEQQRKRSLGETGVYEVELICKDNTKKWVIISGAPFYGLNNKFSGSIGIHLDITKRKRIESELILAKNVAEDSLIAKEVFLANISHEIRTPLNAIIGLSQMLNKNDFEPNHKEMLSQVSSASGNLLSLINDLLLMSKLEASGIVLKPDSYSIQNVLKEMIMMLAPSVNEKGVDFIIELNLESSFSHEFDKLRLTQVIQNLLTNAIKFTSEGYVKISANYKKSQEEIEIKIEDSGIGIPEGELNSIFEGFVQASNNNSEVYGGTGLGLSIVNKIVNAMQGNISVRKLKKGTCFTLNFSFPILKKIKLSEKESIDFDAEELIGLKILVAEDNAVNQFLIKKILSEWNLECKIVKNGKEAIELLEVEKFDIVLMDIRMPIMNGIIATKNIRNVQKKYDLRIIALTANAIEEGSLEYWEAGFNDVLIKPFIQEDLLKLLIMNSSRKSNRNKKNLISFAQDNLSFAETLRSIFIEDSLKRISEMRKASEEGNLQEISDIAHSMKPSLAQLASKNIQDLNKLFEKKEIDENNLLLKMEIFEMHINILIEDLKSFSLN